MASIKEKELSFLEESIKNFKEELLVVEEEKEKFIKENRPSTLIRAMENEIAACEKRIEDLNEKLQNKK